MLKIFCFFFFFSKMLVISSNILKHIGKHVKVKLKVKLKQSNYRPGVAQRIPGS